MICQARPVRQRAGENLGALAALSARADALANDLAASASTASSGGQEAYLVALRGVLASAGAKLTPATLAKAGAALQQLLSSAGGCQSSTSVPVVCRAVLHCQTHHYDCCG